MNLLNILDILYIGLSEVDIVLQLPFVLAYFFSIFMRYDLLIFAVVIFCLQDYAVQEKEAETPESVCVVQVVSTSTWLQHSDHRAAPLHLQSIGEPSLQRSWFPAPADISNGHRHPWRCHWCKRLNKALAPQCGSCHTSWDKRIDIHYVHGQKTYHPTRPM